MRTKSYIVVERWEEQQDGKVCPCVENNYVFYCLEKENDGWLDRNSFSFVEVWKRKQELEEEEEKERFLVTAL